MTNLTGKQFLDLWTSVGLLFRTGFDVSGLRQIRREKDSVYYHPRGLVVHQPLVNQFNPMESSQRFACSVNYDAIL
jgi:hypothetical protein